MVMVEGSRTQLLPCYRRRDSWLAQRTQETPLRLTWVAVWRVAPHLKFCLYSWRRGRDAAQTTNSLHQHSTFRIRKRISFQQVPVQVSSELHRSENKYFIQILIWNILIVSFQTTKNRDSGCFGSDWASSQGKCRLGLVTRENVYLVASLAHFCFKILRPISHQIQDLL